MQLINESLLECIHGVFNFFCSSTQKTHILNVPAGSQTYAGHRRNTFHAPRNPLPFAPWGGLRQKYRGRVKEKRSRRKCPEAILGKWFYFPLGKGLHDN